MSPAATNANGLLRLAGPVALAVTLLGACSDETKPASHLPKTSDQLSPPLVEGPLHECARTLLVRAIPGAQVEVRAAGQVVGGPVVPWLDQVKLSQALKAGQGVDARQKYHGQWSRFTPVGVVVKEAPKPAPEVVVDDRVYDCGRVVNVRDAIPGATVTVLQDGVEIGQRQVPRANDWVVTTPMSAGKRITAKQEVCPDDAEKHNVAKSWNGPRVRKEPVPYPEVDFAPPGKPIEGSSRISLINLVVGASVGAQSGTVDLLTGAFANASRNFWETSQPIPEGEVHVKSRLCGVGETASAGTIPPPSPRLHDPCAHAYGLRLSGTVDGARIAIWDDKGNMLGVGAAQQKETHLPLSPAASNQLTVGRKIWAYQLTDSVVSGRSNEAHVKQCQASACVPDWTEPICTTPPLSPAQDRKHLDGNALQGFASWGEAKNQFPHSLEFHRIKLNELSKDGKTWNFQPVDDALSAVDQRGNHAILRPIIHDVHGLYTPQGSTEEIDEPDDIHVPEDLVDQAVSAKEPGKQGDEKELDYDFLKGSLKDFIQEFGLRYDGDPRIGYVQLGLLGFWGEWHTHQGDTGNGGLFPDTAYQDEIQNAYRAAFRGTPLMNRLPFGTDSKGMGFYDDSFTHETLGPDNFVESLVDAGVAQRWREEPIGGEIYPDNQPTAFGSPPPDQPYDQCVDETHATFILNVHAFGDGYTGGDLTAAKQGARKLGSAFHLNVGTLQRAHDPGCGWAGLRVEIKLTNIGVAPFYGPLAVALLDASGMEVARHRLPDRLHPGTLYEFVLPMKEGAGPFALSLVSPRIRPGQRFSWATDGATSAGTLTIQNCP